MTVAAVLCRLLGCTAQPPRPRTCLHLTALKIGTQGQPPTKNCLFNHKAVNAKFLLGMSSPSFYHIGQPSLPGVGNVTGPKAAWRTSQSTTRKAHLDHSRTRPGLHGPGPDVQHGTIRHPALCEAPHCSGPTSSSQPPTPV